MRQARLKPDYQDTWHHCYNRTVGTRADRPFGDAEKEMFVRLLKRLEAFYSVRVVSYTFMSNHFHIILQAPLEAPSEEDAAARYAAFHSRRLPFLLLRRMGANRPPPLCRRHCALSRAHTAASV